MSVIYNYLLEMWMDSGERHEIEIESHALSDAICQVQYQAEEWCKILGKGGLVHWRVAVGYDASQDEIGEILIP